MRLIYVKMVDMTNADDQPLGYLMYRIMAALRPAVTRASIERKIAGEIQA